MGIKMLRLFMISPPRRVAGILVVCVSAFLTLACERVPLLAPSGSTITLVASATALPANGTADIIAQVIESGGSPPHSGTLVSFTTSFGAVQPSQAETDVSGRVTVKYVAGNGSGTATITAISGGVSASGTNAIKILVGSAAVGRVIVSANPTLVSSLGGITAITSVVLDINGNPLSNVPVSFSTTAGTLADAVANTDQNGTAQTTLRTAQTATVTASVGATAPATPTTPTTPPTTPPATGGTAGQASGTVTVGVATAPTLAITPPTTSPSAGLPAIFSIVVTPATAGGSAVRDVTINWGDGTGVQDLGAISGTASVTHVYRIAGSYVVSATVTDASGNTSQVSTSITVIPVPRPAIIITPQVTGHQATLNIQVTLAAGISVQDMHIDFGDGQAADLGGATSASVTHTYAAPGSYTVRVTVIDTTGQTTVGTAAVTINPP